MTRLQFVCNLLMVVMIGLSLYWIGVAIGRRRVIREMTDIATCPTCDGVGLVVQEEAP